MKSELLLRIKDAEAAATDRIARAEEEAKAIVAEAQQQANAVLADGMAKADAAYHDEIQSARSDTDAKAATIAASGKKQESQLAARFQAGVDGVVGRALKLFEETL